MTRTVIRLLPGGDPGTGMQPSALTDPDAFTTPDRSELAHEFFADAAAGISAGIWKCAPCRETIDAYPVHEMMIVISGRVTLTDADGRVESFAAGDTFFIAKGTPCIWEITETLTKYYMSVE